jgi:hypothetical protein
MLQMLGSFAEFEVRALLGILKMLETVPHSCAECSSCHKLFEFIISQIPIGDDF